ncbi:hypothetical protein VCB98_09325 [Gammaproteobacteria bacterium AB-CW1]|uniref:Uncharacterized protein n=1 Tax=Natronospira elongata TaxID=3110268 RepID=A0AAP6JFR6_9GAMM|nr:hypothetical protein [Gammaproteobacteria bacterium AB-CW1]
MTAFLVVVAIGALISFSVMVWRDADARVRRLAQIAVIVAGAGLLVEMVATGFNLINITPGFSFVIAAGLAFGLALPGMILYAMPK